MSQRFNPPPNWPTPPEGWTPPAGWTPDPSWGPPPEGWQLWLDDDPSTFAITPDAATTAVGAGRKWIWPVVALAALLVGIAIGAASADGDGSSTTAVTAGGSTASALPAPTVTVTEEVPGPETTATVTAEPAGPEHVIEEGQWEVGADIKPGRYKVIDPVTGNCYWKISPTGNPGDIIDNDIVTGGKPTVTLKQGQDFTNRGCGTWGRL
jgi:hypothetical protein